MVETRSRRKSVAPPAAGTPAGSSGRASGGGNEPLSQLPSTSGRRASEQQNGSAAAGDHISYADVYRQAAMQAKQAEQASILRRIKGRASLFYHQQAMTWGWYMLEPWETLLWMGMLLSLFWLVVSACFLNPSSICGTTLAAARKALADQGARLLALTR
ncbi:hypothetical protein ABPG77_001543 [Micractinium sp. CCAP 211/92]